MEIMLINFVKGVQNFRYFWTGGTKIGGLIFFCDRSLNVLQLKCSLDNVVVAGMLS